MKRLLFLGILFASAGNLFAQDSNCGQKLRLASSIYDQGRLHELEGLLEPCLKPGGFSPSEMVTAYKFLALAYIYLEEPEKADAMMLKILQTDHYFEVNEQVDPAEFKALYNTFRTWEVYRLGLRLGGNMTFANLNSSTSVTSGNSKYRPAYGFSASFAAEIPLYKISKRLTFAPELQLQLSSVKYKSTLTDDNNSTFIRNANQSYSYLSLPVLVQYELGDKNQMNNRNRKIRPYILGGIAPDYLFRAKTTGTNSREGYAAVEDNSQPLSTLNKINFSAVLGAGMRWRIAGGFFVAEARFKYGFNKVQNSAKTYSNQTETFGGFAPDIYRINTISVTVGYVQNFFNPKKLKPRK